MNNIINSINEYISLVEGKFTIATIFMSVIVILILTIVIIVISAVKRRSQASTVELPEIDGEGIVEKSKPQFIQNAEVSVELIDSSEDNPKFGSTEEKDPTAFQKTLALETGGEVIDKDSIQKIDLPEINFEQLEEEEKAKQELKSKELLAELAKADNEVELLKAESTEDEKQNIDYMLNNAASISED